MEGSALMTKPSIPAQLAAIGQANYSIKRSSIFSSLLFSSFWLSSSPSF
jgi:hypothetical protein